MINENILRIKNYPMFFFRDFWRVILAITMKYIWQTIIETVFGRTHKQTVTFCFICNCKEQGQKTKEKIVCTA